MTNIIYFLKYDYLFNQAFQRLRSSLANVSLSSKESKKVKVVAVINHHIVYAINILVIHLLHFLGTYKFCGTPYEEKCCFRFPPVGS